MNPREPPAITSETGSGCCIPTQCFQDVLGHSAVANENLNGADLFGKSAMLTENGFPKGAAITALIAVPSDQEQVSSSSFNLLLVDTEITQKPQTPGKNVSNYVCAQNLFVRAQRRRL